MLLFVVFGKWPSGRVRKFFPLREAQQRRGHRRSALIDPLQIVAAKGEFVFPTVFSTGRAQPEPVGNARSSRLRPSTKPRPHAHSDPPRRPRPQVFYLLHAPSTGPAPSALSHSKTGSFTGFPLRFRLFFQSRPFLAATVSGRVGFSEGAVFSGPVVWAMGVPKRKASGGPSGAASPVGTAKRTRAEEFTGVRFKTQLKDAQGPGPGE